MPVKYNPNLLARVRPKSRRRQDVLKGVSSFKIKLIFQFTKSLPCLFTTYIIASSLDYLPYVVHISFYIGIRVSFSGTRCAWNESTVQHIAALDNFLTENLAVRSNGHVLVTTSAPVAIMLQSEPFAARNGTLVFRFPGVSGSHSITELQTDMF